MFFKRPELTTGARPTLRHDEALLFVQNGVGLYEGKFKIADSQNGHAYLTTHRACYVDDDSPQEHSLAVDLKDVDRTEFTAGFLRSSPKVTLHPKPLRRGPGSLRQSGLHQGVQRLQLSSSSPASRSASPFRSIQATPSQDAASVASWVCPICTFSNPVPSNFDPATATASVPVPPCLTCGIAPDFAVVLKAAISAGSKRTPIPIPSDQNRQPSEDAPESSDQICPRCTFHNHPSLRSCELCGSPLPSLQINSTDNFHTLDRAASPAPEISHASESDEPVSVKFSFRAGGDKIFHERLKGALVQRKWLAADAPPVPKPLDGLRRSEPSSPTMAGFEGRNSPRSSRVGIAGLEQLGKQSQKDNEVVIGAAFEDLESLMALDKEVSALAQKIAREFGDEANRTDVDADISSPVVPGMFASKDMLSSTSEKLYLSELSRNLAEYVTDDKRGLLRRRGGTMSLVDLWATYNRSRDGVELVSPADFHTAATMWAALNLPVRLRQFKSGLMAVQYAYTSDERTVEQLKKWLKALQLVPRSDASWDWQYYGCGVTAQDAAKKFGWSLGIATEELEMAEDKGAVVRDESIEGLKFWLNFFDQPDEDESISESSVTGASTIDYVKV